MVALFKDRSPATIIWLFLLNLVVHSQFFIFLPSVQARQDDGLLSLILNEYVAGLSPAVIVLIYHLTVLVQALRLNFLFTDHRMYNTTSYMPAMVYVLLTGLFRDWNNLTPALVVNIMVIWLFSKITKLYNTPNPKTLLFNIGLVIGASVLLYHPCAMLIVVAFFAVIIVRPFIITELVVLLMGVLCPFYFLISYLYMTDRLPTLYNYIPDWQLNVPHVTLSPIFFVTIGLIVFILLTGLFYWQNESRRVIIQIRKNWVVLLSMLFVLLPTAFMHKNAGMESMLLWIVPASPFIARGFLGPKRNTVPALMFWSLLIVAILKNWQIVQ